jgi:hypothetical protein
MGVVRYQMEIVGVPKGYLEDESQKWSGGICDYVHE